MDALTPDCSKSPGLASYDLKNTLIEPNPVASSRCITSHYTESFFLLSHCHWMDWGNSLHSKVGRNPRFVTHNVPVFFTCRPSGIAVECSGALAFLFCKKYPVVARQWNSKSSRLDWVGASASTAWFTKFEKRLNIAFVFDVLDFIRPSKLLLFFTSLLSSRTKRRYSPLLS